MDEAALHELLSGRRRDVGARLLRSGLHLASWGYGAAIRLRNLGYDCAWLRMAKADVPVISLGNITTGGTGKTPLAAWLANWLNEVGRTPGLLSRGYRSLDGAANDEKLVLDRLCVGVPHVQQQDRVTAATRLVSEHSCDVLIVDDGFQHRRLHRDLDLVLVDALQPWGYGHLLPRGLLRESLSGLRRADIVLLTRADCVTVEQRGELRRDLQRWRGTDDCVEVAFVPQRLLGVDGRERPVSDLAGCRPFSFCGIGNPRGFRQTLERLGAACDLTTFPDHHHYSTDELGALSQATRDASADIVLTTLKDLVKIVPAAWSGSPLFAVDIGVEFLSGRELLESRLQQLLDDKSAPRGGNDRYEPPVDGAGRLL